MKTKQLPTIGDVIDERYELRREIASGGTAVVYEAQHTHLERRVALKMLRPELARSEVAVARLAREGRALSRARSRGLVEIYDVHLAMPTTYLALELLEGKSLDGLLAARGKLDLESAAIVTASVAATLERLHAVGIVHRDIKPSNVVVSVDDRGVEIPKVIDLGVASLAEHASSGPIPKITRIGDVVGTFEYMAPEQLLGEAVDHRADVYALATMFYELASGDVPFPGSYAAVLGAVSKGQAPAPLHGKVPGVVAALDDVLARALSRDPARRHPDIASFAAAIRMMTQPKTDTLRLLGRATPNGPQNRQHRRAPFITPVRVLLSNGRSVDGRSEDISEGGLMVICQEALDAEQEVRVRFSLPRSGRVVSPRAVVRWSRGARMQMALGLAFHELETVARDEVLSYVDMIGTT